MDTDFLTKPGKTSRKGSSATQSCQVDEDQQENK